MLQYHQLDYDAKRKISAYINWNGAENIPYPRMPDPVLYYRPLVRSFEKVAWDAARDGHHFFSFSPAEYVWRNLLRKPY